MSVSPLDFVPLRKLGMGSFGDVYLVRKGGKLYAMKSLQKKSEKAWLRYVKTERDVLAHVTSPYIAKLNYAF